jgi:protein CrcB
MTPTKDSAVGVCPEPAAWRVFLRPLPEHIGNGAGSLVRPIIGGLQMLTYFYIALGGAIGSVARAWTTNVMTRALGPHFPWGTILINVVGSFIIGVFGALTATDGRFTAHPDARAFVMVGICGGYTTFSSFSLQTLDLIRDGKPGAAFANIALSVILCLLSVTAGYASATVLNEAGQAKTRALKGRTMGGVVVAVMDRPETVGTMLSSAAALLAIGGGGHIEALAARTPPRAELMVADQIVTPAEEERLRAAEAAWASEVKAMVERWEAQAKPKSVSINLIDVEGDVAHLVAQHGRRSDEVVVTGSARQSGRSRDALHAAIFDTSRAVLIAPPNSTGAFGKVVAIAWKDDIRAPKAVFAAMPILAKAESVHVLQADVSGGDLGIPPILEEHGVLAFVHAVPGHEGPVGERLLKFAHELGASLIVMGAYAHGEWREALLGGVTRYMLDHADLPVLMRH